MAVRIRDILLSFVSCVGCHPSSGVRSALQSGGPALEAVVTVDEDDGDFPLRVTFDGSASSLGDGDVTWLWSFGDGALVQDGPTALHTYIGAGEFQASLTLLDGTGRQSVASVTIDVDRPDCPGDDAPLTLGDVEDDALDEISGIAASRIVQDAYWVHNDRDEDEIAAVDLRGRVLSGYELPERLEDIEDIAAVVDPFTHEPLLFLADIGDNDEERDDVAIWIAPEPSPLVDGDLDAYEVRLTYPSGPRDAEALLVDPFTLDLFVFTKESDPEVYVKRAPHAPGHFVFDRLGRFDDLDFRPTAADVSLDGLRVVMRTYHETARVWARDGYRPLEEVFEDEPCEVDLPDRSRAEAITATLDGRGFVTTSEGEHEPLYYIGTRP